MARKDPYDVVKHRYITEKSMMLEQLKNAKANAPKSLARFELPKYVFIVDKKANKQEIAKAVEEIYSEKSVKVVAVNTINMKGKTKRVRGKLGTTAAYKKAVVTLSKDDEIDDV